MVNIRRDSQDPNGISRKELKTKRLSVLSQEGPGKSREGWGMMWTTVFHKRQLTLKTSQWGEKAICLDFVLMSKPVNSSRSFVSVMAPLLLLLTEQVSTPEIKVLNKTQENENGTCSLILACTVNKGDHVAYSWSDEAGTHLLSRANHSHLLYVTLSNQHHDSIYNCTASNPVSSRSRTFNVWQECRLESSGEYSWQLGHLINENPILRASIASPCQWYLFSLYCRSLQAHSTKVLSGWPQWHYTTFGLQLKNRKGKNKQTNKQQNQNSGLQGKTLLHAVCPATRS